MEEGDKHVGPTAIRNAGSVLYAVTPSVVEGRATMRIPQGRAMPHNWAFSQGADSKGKVEAHPSTTLAVTGGDYASK